MLMRLRRSAAGCAGALALAVITVGPIPAAADDGAPMILASAARAPEQVHEPTLLDRIAHWLDRSASDLKSGVTASKAALDRVGGHAAAAARDAGHGATDAVEDTVGSIAALPRMRIVDKRERCQPAANGAPDCARAAERICHGKGLRGGKSLEIQSEENCPIKVLLAGGPHPPGACRTETFVIRAVCQ